MATRRVRLVAWSVIFALAIFQAFAQRYVIGPDGISYLDLSDAVVTGHWSLLLNTYWSPLYPVLIGVARAIGGTGPDLETPIVHAANLVAFAGMAAAFEYMLMSVLALAAKSRHSALGGPWGLAGAYGLFAMFALTMIPLELTTPDHLCAAMVFVAFGALLRLHAGSPRPRRDAIVLGAALGLGVLVKSFMVPWAVVCFVTLALAVRPRGVELAAVSAAVWACVLIPWTVALSRAAGRLTMGDAGRLTYAWYVNAQNAPSLGNVPMGARTDRTEAILPGAGATGDAPGTDPMWFDPARWNTTTSPHWNLHDQIETLRVFAIFYIQNLTPLVFLLVLIAAAPRGARRDAWRNGWIVYVPAFAGIMAYAMVIVTARYIMPFVLTASLVLLAALPLTRRMSPLGVLFGILVSIGIESITPRTALGLALVASVLGAMIAGAFTPTRVKAVWVVAVVAALGMTRKVLAPTELGLLRVGACALALLIFIAARAAIRDRRPVRFAYRVQASMGLALAVLLTLRFGLRIDQDSQQLNASLNPAWANVPLGIAQELDAHGITPGTRIAVIGPHAESYWARTARLKIVANVPRTLTAEFWRLSPAGRDSLLVAFANVGATVAIATVGPDAGSPDSTWMPVKYHGWIRRLSR